MTEFGALRTWDVAKPGDHARGSSAGRTANQGVPAAGSPANKRSATTYYPARDSRAGASQPPFSR